MYNLRVIPFYLREGIHHVSHTLSLTYRKLLHRALKGLQKRNYAKRANHEHSHERCTPEINGCRAKFETICLYT